MKELGIFFTDEQKKLLSEIDNLEKHKDCEFEKDLVKEINHHDDRKIITTLDRIQFASIIQKKYSLLNKNDTLFSSQLFSAFEEYLKEYRNSNCILKGL